VSRCEFPSAPHARAALGWAGTPPTARCQRPLGDRTADEILVWHKTAARGWWKRVARSSAFRRRMLRRLCEDRLFRLAPHHVLTPAGWIDLGAFQDLSHELASCVIGVEMIDDTRALRHTVCPVCMGGNTFFSDATATMRHPNGGVEVTGGERIMSPRMSPFGEVIEQER
jgi:hypothetical protein